MSKDNPVAVFEGYVDNTPIISWIGAPLSAGAKLYAKQPCEPELAASMLASLTRGVTLLFSQMEVGKWVSSRGSDVRFNSAVQALRSSWFAAHEFLKPVSADLTEAKAHVTYLCDLQLLAAGLTTYSGLTDLLRLHDDVLADIAERLSVVTDTEIATTAARIFNAIDRRNASMGDENE